MSEPRIPLARPDIGAAERREVASALREGGISGKARHVGLFEQAFSEAMAGRHCVAVSSGTAALHLALAGLDIGPGDEVIVPDLTYVATANAVAYTGARPVLVDVDPTSWCLDPAAVSRRIGRRTRAILAVHLYGTPADMVALRRLARDAGLALIEDGAQALGSRHRGRPVGSLGDAACFSFFANKVVTSGEGGMVVTRRAALARRLRALRDHATSGASARRRYHHAELGFNYRMPALSAAVGVAQMRRFESFCATRRKLGSWYAEGLAKAASPVEFPAGGPGTDCVPWLVTARLRGAGRERRDRVVAALQRAGIDARPVFEPMSRQPMYRRASGPMPQAAAISRESLSLPTFTGLRRAEVDEICDRLTRALGGQGRR